MLTRPLTLGEPEPGVRLRMLEILGGAQVPGTDDVLMQGLLDADERVGRRAGEILAHRYPWLALDAAKAYVPGAAAWSRYRFGAAWRRLREALARTLRALPPDAHLALERYTPIPAMLPDVVQVLVSLGRTDEADRVADYQRREGPRGGFARQILFAVTYACNLKCPYCYVKQWERELSGAMTVASFRTALAWCRRQGIDWIILGGGEPTVHREFPALIAAAARSGAAVSLTSNGLYGAAVRACVRAPDIPEFICHVEQDILRHDRERAAAMRRNIEAALAANVAVRIRYTLTAQSDGAERRAVLGVAREFGLDTLNYGFAFQNVDASNAAFAHDGADGGCFDGTLNRFMDEAREAGVGLHLSKPFPLCHVRPTTLRRALAEGGLRMACSAWRRGYSMNLTVNPDLTTLPCNALRRPGPRLTEFADLAAAGAYHAATLKPLFDHPWQPKCRRCVLFHRGVCQGVCLAEHLAAQPDGAAAKGCGT